MKKKNLKNTETKFKIYSWPTIENLKYEKWDSQNVIFQTNNIICSAFLPFLLMALHRLNSILIGAISYFKNKRQVIWLALLLHTKPAKMH